MKHAWKYLAVVLPLLSLGGCMTMKDTDPAKYAAFESALRKYQDCTARALVIVHGVDRWAGDAEDAAAKVVALCDNDLDDFIVELGADEAFLEARQMALWQAFHREVLSVIKAKQAG